MRITKVIFLFEVKNNCIGKTRSRGTNSRFAVVMTLFISSCSNFRFDPLLLHLKDVKYSEFSLSKAKF